MVDRDRAKHRGPTFIQNAIPNGFKTLTLTNVQMQRSREAIKAVMCKRVQSITQNDVTR